MAEVMQMTYEESAQFERLDRNLAEIARDFVALKARVIATYGPPADAQTVPLRHHVSARASLMLRECECDDDGCHCDISELN